MVDILRNAMDAFMLAVQRQKAIRHPKRPSVHVLGRTAMSNLYRSAISARASKLPNLPPIPSTHSTRHPDYDPDEQEGDEEEEEGDGLGSLPGSGMGPPAM